MVKFRDFYETLIELNEQSQQSLLVSIRLHYTLETGYEEQFDEKINKYISEKNFDKINKKSCELQILSLFEEYK